MEREVDAGTRAPHERRAALLLAARRRGGGAACRIACAGRRGRVVEDQVRDGYAADPVHEAVVHLGDEAPAAAGKPVEQRHLPQRPAAVEPVGVEVRHPVEQLGVAAGSGQGRVAHVGRDVEVGVRLPVAASAARPCAGARAACGSAASPPGARSSSARTSSTDGTRPPSSGSKTIAQPMCMCEHSSACSSSRKAASSGVSCSLFMYYEGSPAWRPGHPQRLRIRGHPFADDYRRPHRESTLARLARAG